MPQLRGAYAEMARPRVSRGWRKVYHAKGVVAPYMATVGPQLAEAIIFLTACGAKKRALP